MIFSRKNKLNDEQIKRIWSRKLLNHKSSSDSVKSFSPNTRKPYFATSKGLQVYPVSRNIKENLSNYVKSRSEQKKEHFAKFLVVMIKPTGIL